MKSILSLVLTFALSIYLAITPPSTHKRVELPGTTDSHDIAHAFAEHCTASWYGPGFHGKQMANGRAFDQFDPQVVAHKSLPLGTKLVITNRENGRSIVATVKDRGPYITGRCIDLSYAAAERLKFVTEGVARVTIRIAHI